MGEFKTSDVSETKKPDVENYKNIKPESDITVKESKGFWDNQFSENNNSIEKENAQQEKVDGNTDYYDDNGHLNIKEKDLVPNSEYTMKDDEYKTDDAGRVVSVKEKLHIKEHEGPEKKGGSFRDVFKGGEGNIREVHHMPADIFTELSREDGPAIKMDIEDHRITASCGSSKEARDYRNIQKQFIEEGKFREALKMDIDDLREKFGDKYDEAISEMLVYVEKLEQEDRI